MGNQEPAGREVRQGIAFLFLFLGEREMMTVLLDLLAVLAGVEIIAECSVLPRHTVVPALAPAYAYNFPC